MASGGTNGVAIIALLGGSVLAYSGLKGKSISSVARAVLEGQNPSDLVTTNPITDPAATVGNVGGVGSSTGTVPPSTNSGQLTYAQIRNYWTEAGGPGGAVAVVAAAITEPESGRNPGEVQQGQPYSSTGWGLWQITPGDSEPQIGTDSQLLDPETNARAAVAKFKAAGNSFSPWTTYTSGKYAAYLGAAAQ